MDAAVLYAVVEGVQSKARLVARQEDTIEGGLREDLVGVSRILERLRPFLRSAEDRGITNDETIMGTLQNLGKALIDFDHLLEDYRYEMEGSKVVQGTMNKVRNFFSSSNPLVIRYRMAPKVEGIKLLVDEIDRNVYEILDVTIGRYAGSTVPRLLTPNYLHDEEIVGRDDDIEKIVSLLLTWSQDSYGTEHVSVIGIVGMAGQGKTAIAKELFKNEKVKKHFEINVWISIGYGVKLETVPAHMYQILTGEDPALKNRVAMLNSLRRTVYEKRCLIVLDDVWDENSTTWHELRSMLKKQSKIIVITRDAGVVQKMGGFVYPLGALSEEKSQELFEKIAFADDKAMKNGEFLKMSKTIVNKCEGLPLAIQAVGRLLRSTGDASEWSKIAEAYTWGSFDGLKEVLSSIKLSFDSLPSPSLKHCFAYCAIFPKGSTIERKPLIQQWMSQEFLLPNSEQQRFLSDLVSYQERIGEWCFETFLQKSLFQSVEFDVSGDVKSCKMHNLVHDVALKASRGYCLTIEGGSTIENMKPVHLYITANGGQSIDNTSSEELSGLRTLFLHGSILPKDISAKCKYLRVFVVRDSTIENFPDYINRLKFLEYLDIIGTRIRILPNSITTLKRLQTLRVGKLLEMPRDFHKLFLRHLHVQTKYHILLPNISRMSSLQTLPYFVVSRDSSGCQIRELCFLRRLEGSLSIYGLENVKNFEEAAKAELVTMEKIVNLELYWDSDLGEDFDYEGVLKGLEPRTEL